MSIRQKLWLGIGGMLVILLTVSVLGNLVINSTNRSIDAMFKNNYDSVVYAHRMIDALEQANTGLQIVALRGRADTKTRAFLQREDTEFADNLALQRGNVTEVGEQALTDQLGAAWAAYLKDEAALLKQPTRPGLYRERLRPGYQAIKETAWKIANLNLTDMSLYRGRAVKVGRVTDRWMDLLLLAGVLLTLGFMTMVGRSILSPIRSLTKSAKEIQKGNLDLTVEVRSRDELGQLAEAFNDMAGRLRESRRSSRARLLRIQRTTQMAIDSLADPVALLSTAGQVEMANPAAEEFFALKTGSVPRSGALSGLKEKMQRVLAEGRALEPKGYEEALQVFREGQEKFFLPRLTPVLDENRHVAGLTLVLVDVTGLRKMDEMKSGLVSTVSHELKTPLTSLRMATHLLLDEALGQLNPKQEELILAAREDADRLWAILENLLDMSRMEAGQGLLDFKPLRAQDLAMDAVEALRADFQDKGVKLDLEMAGDLPSVKADPLRISRVFSNLLGNALKYSPGGSLVRLSARAAGGRVVFRVEDAGPGIPAEYLEKVFDKFFRVPGQAQGGAGLGLSIAKDIVELHGGGISAGGGAGKGSVFEFWLPQA